METYRQLATRFPESTNAPYALYQAAEMYVERGNTADARATFESLVAKYPAHDIGFDRRCCI